MLYLDTSVLVAALTNEPHTSRMQEWLGGQVPDELMVSDWVAAEFSSALAIKLRTSQIGPEDRAHSLAAFSHLCDSSFQILPVERPHFRLAARFADQFALGLRAGDALHLAICSEYAATMCTLDRRLAQGATALGVKTIVP